MKPVLLWVVAVGIAAVIIAAFPVQAPQFKWLYAIITGLATTVAGYVQMRVAKRSPDSPLKAVGVGSALRIVGVLILVIVAKLTVPNDDLIGVVVSIFVMYFAIQLAELPTLVAQLGSIEQSKP